MRHTVKTLGERHQASLVSVFGVGHFSLRDIAIDANGIDRVLPPISGFVLTQTKDSPLAQVLIQSPKPDSPENATILAVWTYGLGRTAALTTDGGARWASSWTEWAGYEKFHSQLVRWLMRPTGDTGKFTIATKVEDGQVEVRQGGTGLCGSTRDFGRRKSRTGRC